jgi:DNA polymerase
MERAAQIAEIEAELLAMVESPLYEYRVSNNYQPVVGEGSLSAEIMFIGEAPGEMEARSGRPFIGNAGRVLDSLLQSIGLERSAVYITSVVKDRPPDNRDPRAKEVRLYAPFLWRQIQIIQPRVIAPMGRHALDFIRGHFAGLPAEGSISTLHGRAFPVEAGYGRVFIVPLYHPAAVFYREELQATLEEDFRLLGELVRRRPPVG